MKVPFVYTLPPPSEDGEAANGLVSWLLSNLSTRVIRYLQSAHDASVFLASLDNTVLRYRVPKVMLFLKSGEPPSPSFIATAQDNRYRALWAVVDAVAGDELAESYNVTIRPSLVVVVPQAPAVTDGGATTAAAHTVHRLYTLPLFRPPTTDEAQRLGVGRVYQGHAAVRTFLDAYMLNTTESASVREALMYVYSTYFEDIATAERVVDAPRPIVPLRHAAAWNADCVRRPQGYCLVVLVDPTDTAASPLSATELSEIARSWQQRRNSPLQTVVIDAVDVNAPIAKALGAVNGLPDIVVLHPARTRFVRLQGAPNAKGVLRWIGEAASWKWQTLSPLPPFVEAAGASGEL